MWQMPTSYLSTSGLTRHRVCDSSGDTWEEDHDASIYNMCVNADEAAAVENLRAELARAKEQARKSDAAALKAIEELKAE